MKCARKVTFNAVIVGLSDDPAFTKNVRVRFAPSPTGWMHIGSIRQILYNYLWARKNKGSFILRIEDTDIARTVEGGIDSIYETFDAFGIDVDEGPKNGGKYGPYVQSERLDIYKKYADELVKKDAAYFCFCSKERLDELREKQVANKQQPMYDGLCRSLSTSEVEEKIKKSIPHVIRLKVPQTGVTEYHDVLHGTIRFKNSVIDDQVLLKSDGYPTYHFAAVVDDHLMEISHVIRGEEYVSSAPKVVLMYQAFEWKMPYLVQTPNVLNPDGKKKLSKRGGSNTSHKFLRRGYLVEALWNFLVLLGWAPTGSEGKQDEIYTREDLLKLFDVRRIKKAGARFLPEKLNHFNGYYIREMSIDDLYARIIKWAEEYVLKDFIADRVVELEEWEVTLRKDIKDLLPRWKKESDYFKEILKLEHERLVYLAEIPGLVRFFYADSLKYDRGLFDKVGEGKKSDLLHGLWEKLGPVVKQGWKQESWESTIRAYADEKGWKHGDMFMLLRLAMTASTVSPPLFESMKLMGADRCEKFINDAINSLK